MEPSRTFSCQTIVILASFLDINGAVGARGTEFTTQELSPSLQDNSASVRGEYLKYQTPSRYHKAWRLRRLSAAIIHLLANLSLVPRVSFIYFIGPSYQLEGQGSAML